MAECCSRKKSAWQPVALFVYFIVNIRVAAGIATTFERMLDGLVACATLLVLLYIVARFTETNDNEHSCCNPGK